MSETGIRILHLEDDPNDAELIRAALMSAGMGAQIVRVETRREFEARLGQWKPDVILADHNLPTFDGFSALKVVREQGRELPFIFVSGTVGEEVAVDVLRQGATDYVLKDRLGRLPAAISRALVENRDRRLREETESRLREIAHTVREAFWILTPAMDRVLYVSAAFERIWGRPSGDILDKSPRELLNFVHADDRARVEEELAGKFNEGEAESEHRIVRPDGKVRWVRHHTYFVRDRSGKVERIIATTDDITEARGLKEQFLQSQKMEAVGRLAGGVAHDFNNLLTIIAGYAELALARLGNEDPLREMIEEMAAAGEKASLLTRQLLTFSRKQVTEARVLDLRRVIAGLEKMLKRLLGSDTELVTGVSGELWNVFADPGHVEQILVNLVVNARDAMPNGGRITIEARNEPFKPVEPATRDPIPPGDYVCLTVTDTGVGMGPEILAHLFEPFFTTKEPGKGTGLGLSTVHGIVRQSGGAVDVSSELGKGSTFRILLPRCKEQVTTVRRVAAAPALIGTETILLAEDSDTVRRLCEELLKAGGYRVLSTSDGEAALREIKDNPAEIHLLIADLIMPHIGGAELMAHAAKVRPAMKTLLMSGYPQHGEHRQAGGPVYLSKPFTRDSLLQKVREALRK
ncbi:MAG TPA: response regulator [Planctomycetota bacterium]